MLIRNILACFSFCMAQQIILLCFLVKVTGIPYKSFLPFVIHPVWSSGKDSALSPPWLGFDSPHRSHDNGTNFVGTANEIRRMIRRWKEDTTDRKALADFCNGNEMKWSFSTPLAPHHNGCVEAMVKSVKNTLNKIVRHHLLSEEEYRRVLSKVTTCVNSRPLWPSNDDSMERPIRPIDLLRPSELPVDPKELNQSTNVEHHYPLPTSAKCY